MTLEEFLRWEDGTDTRYQLVEGIPQAMAPPASAHGILCARLGGMIDAALRSTRPCTVRTEAGIACADRDDTCYIADLAVTCKPHQRGEQLVDEPLLIVEILSPGTEAFDRKVKSPGYREIASVREILFLDSEGYYGELLRREGERWITELVLGKDAVLSLSSVPLRVAMSELYDGIELAAA
jgi:Uma2 family endonuclease